jgi:hypothetical protein
VGPGLYARQGGHLGARHPQPAKAHRVPVRLGTGLTAAPCPCRDPWEAFGRPPIRRSAAVQLTPHDTAPYDHELATAVRAPHGARRNVVVTTAFDYVASDNAAVLKSDNDLLAHEFPHARLTNIARKRHRRCQPWPPIASRGPAAIPGALSRRSLPPPAARRRGVALTKNSRET